MIHVYEIHIYKIHVYEDCRCVRVHMSKLYIHSPVYTVLISMSSLLGSRMNFKINPAQLHRESVHSMHTNANSKRELPARGGGGGWGMGGNCVGQ